MSAATFGLLAVTVALAAFVQGSTGLGFALISTPVIGLSQPELLPVAVLVLMVPLNVYVAGRERSSVDIRGAGWVSVGRLAGTAGGLAVLIAIPTGSLNLLVGGCTVLAALASLFAPSFRPGRSALATAGVVTGVTETATGVGGPPLALVYQHRPAHVLRSTVALCFLIGEVLSIAVLLITGEAGTTQFVTAALLLPALAVGAILSRYVHHRLHGSRMRVAVLVFALVSGIALLIGF